MVEDIIKTDVDKFIEILKLKKKIELNELAKELKLSEEIVQQWADFLVEEKIITMDYNFTKPIISIIEEEHNPNMTKEELNKYKKLFQEHKNKKQTPEILWREHIQKNLQYMKTFFYQEAEKRNLENIDQLWQEYNEKAMQL